MRGPDGEARDRGRAVAVGRQALRLRHAVAGPGRGHRRVPDPRQRHGEEDVPGAADGAGAQPALRPRGRARGADRRTRTTGSGRSRRPAHSDYFIGYQSVHGNGPRVAGPAGRRPRRLRRDHRRTPATTARSSTRCSATCTLAGATMPMHYATSARRCTSSTAGSAPASARARDAALPVRRRRAGQGRARQHARRHPAAPVEVPVAPLREHALQPRRHHRARSATPRSRSSTRRFDRLPAADGAGDGPGGTPRLAAPAGRAGP